MDVLTHRSSFVRNAGYRSGVQGRRDQSIVLGKNSLDFGALVKNHTRDTAGHAALLTHSSKHTSQILKSGLFKAAVKPAFRIPVSYALNRHDRLRAFLFFPILFRQAAGRGRSRHLSAPANGQAGRKAKPSSIPARIQTANLKHGRRFQTMARLT
ncbi:hypothetical protein [Novosphingobium sp. YAF33]|uniref:hypothetical protein n=1 Tax=Novosphingobium sp. YAF33 TaxID=3233082 RepID=UPI003F9BD200